ncbi:hypothetical protein [Candidatus Chlorohelix sp.]|uniref:hypothetical protein n=1 Tax=Candidatus Chlorohelix sp. TaxID=3139201 RepID=UPI00304E57BE
MINSENVATIKKKRRISPRLLAALAAVALLLGLASAAFAALPSTTATRVYGQVGDFTANQENNVARTADNLYNPAGVAVASDGGIYVADYQNHRVLHYPSGSTTADRVYGQGGSFSTFAYNKGGVSQDSLDYPVGVAVASDGIYIADSYNNRVLYYSGTSTTATRVYGQADYTTRSYNRGNGNTPSADSLWQPSGVAVVAGGIYIADTYNNRVLYYSGTSTTATRVYGQGDTGSSFTTKISFPVAATNMFHPGGVAVDSNGIYVSDGNNRVLRFPVYNTGGTVDFTPNRIYGQPDGTSGNPNNGSNSGNPTNDSLWQPTGIALASDGSLFVADNAIPNQGGNNRVLHYPSGSTTADRVYGQTNMTGNNSGTTQSTLSSPVGVAVASDGSLYVADYNNNRVLHYAANPSADGPNADRVYGQGGSYTTWLFFAPNTDSLNVPRGVAVAPDGSVFIADSNNNRVLRYTAGSTTASAVWGQSGSFAANTENNGSTPGTPSDDSLSGPIGMAFTSDGSMYVADTGNNRVLFFPADSSGIPAQHATRVYGQKDAYTTGDANKGGIGAQTLNQPDSIAIASGGIFISDSSNNRVLYYSGISNTADRVYGQATFAGGGANRTNVPTYGPTSLYLPYGVAVDASGNLYVADNLNNRVLFFPADSSGVPANDAEATRVYGQANFTDHGYNRGSTPGINTLSKPYGITLADDGSLYVVEWGNNRALHYPAPTGLWTDGPDADGVWGQGGVFTTKDKPNPPTADSLYQSYGVALSPLDGSLFIADGDNNRVVCYGACTANTPPPGGNEVVVAHPADLVPQLRVNPDRVVDTNLENLVSFSFKVKNIGAGSASNLVISMPVPQGLDVGYLEEGATSGVWVTQVTTTTVTIKLPTIEGGKEAHGTLVFRPNISAVAGTQIDVRYNLVFDDATRGGKSLFSNHELFVYGSAEGNSNETKGEVQPGAAVSANAGEKVSIVQTGFLADEFVSLWYTGPDGTSVSLGLPRANANGEVTIVVNTAGLSGSYSVVGYGNRSEFTQVNILTVTAAAG